jgi:hypothetical protein
VKEVPFDEVSNPYGFRLLDVFAEILSLLSKWYSAGAKRDKHKLIVHANNAGSHTALQSAQFFEQNRMKKGVIPLIHLTSHHPTFACLAMPRDVWHVSRLRVQMNFSLQLRAFWRVSNKRPCRRFSSSGWAD